MNSRTLLAIDSGVSDIYNEFAPQIFDALQTLSAAEPILDAPARRNQLRELIEQQLHVLGNRVRDARDGGSGVVRQGLQNEYRPTKTDEAIEQAVTEYLGRIGLAITTQTNTEMKPPHVVHNPVFHGPVGNYQPGDRNTATVTQSVVTQISPTEVKAAIDELIQVLQHEQDIALEQQAEVVEVLEQVKTEADKERPNKLKLSGLIGSVRDVLEGIAAAPGAWDTVKNWYAFITSGAVQAGPVITQAVQNLGS